MTRDGADVLAMLERRGRKRRLCLAAEEAAATGVAGCLAAATVAGAMGVQAEYRGVAIGLTAGLVVLGAVVAAWRRIRERVRPAGPVVAVLIGAGLLGLGVLLTGVGGESRAVLTAAMVAAAVLAGAGPVLTRRVDVAGTARLLDERGGFAERLGTAAQVAARAGDSDAAAMVCRQGEAILRAGRADRVSLWTRTRATPAAVAVAALLWGTVLLLPVIGPREKGQGVDLAAMTPEQKTELIRRIQAAAAEAKAAGVEVPLAEMPAAVEAGDQGAVARMLGELRRAGVDVRSVVGAEFAGMGEGAGEGDGEGGTRSRKRPGREREGGERLGGERAVGGGGPVAWAGPGRPGEQEGAGEGGTGRGGGGEMMPYDKAWRDAAARAAAALDSGSVPLRHRQLVREFFADVGR
ncbi:MAG: hypothetical protein NTV86_11085 [Planctomycetota bacterium]|nr:hypothetical protein [Planctomycetota bacterium]